MRWVVKNSWNKVVFSNESKIMIGHDQQIHFWCKRTEGSRPDLVQPRTSQTRYKVMIGGCISWDGIGTIIPVNGNINVEKYQDILEENLWPVISRHFLRDENFFRNDNAPVHQTRSSQD